MEKSITTAHISFSLVQFIKNEIVAESLEIDENTVLAEIGIDSFSLIEIVLFIERTYGVVLSDDSLNPENLKNIQSIAACTMEQLKMNA